MYFVILQNPSNKKRFALRDEGQDSVKEFDSISSAELAASRTLFGSHGYYEIFDIAGGFI